MKSLINQVKRALREKTDLPFSVYSSVQEQQIFNVPIIKPLLIFVLDGDKKLGKESEVVCSAGDFIFLSNNPTVDMRNIPSSREYFALLIEFEYEDFNVFSQRPRNLENHFLGKIDDNIEKTLYQFVEWSLFAPSSMWAIRRREILQVLYHQGYEQVCSIAETTSVSHKLHDIISANIAEDMNTEVLCSKLAMSESTMRRKLSSEGTNLQEIKDQVRLGFGLHLLQTTSRSIGLIASECGYQSQSRFTDRFKQRFGLTPTELRKTHLHDSV